MKEVFLLLTLLALPAFAETLTLTTSTPDDNKLTRGMNRANKATCSYFGLSAGCTQKQAREQFCKRANVGGQTTCTPDPTSTPQNPKPQICTTTPLVNNCDGANQVNIFASVQEFSQDHFSGWIKSDLAQKNDAEDKATARAAWPTMTQANRDAVCAKIGLSAGCNPW